MDELYSTPWSQLLESDQYRIIKDCAEYLRDKQRRGDRGIGISEIEESIVRLDDIKRFFKNADKAISAALDAINNIHTLDGKCRLSLDNPILSFSSDLSQHRVFNSLGAISDVFVDIEKTLIDIKYIRDVKVSKSQYALQRSAYKLAFAHAWSEKRGVVWDLAKNIMTEAGLDIPTEHTLKKWHNEEKSEDKKGKVI